MSQYKMSRKEVEEIVSQVKFMDRTFRVLDKGEGFLLQMQYMEPDVDKPGSEPVLQSTRKWYISPFMTPSEVVETAWACVMRSMAHVASEHFTYKGRKVYSQHFDIEARIEMCDQYDFDGREPLTLTMESLLKALEPTPLNREDLCSALHCSESEMKALIAQARLEGWVESWAAHTGDGREIHFRVTIHGRRKMGLVP